MNITEDPLFMQLRALAKLGERRQVIDWSECKLAKVTGGNSAAWYSARGKTKLRFEGDEEE